MTTLTNSFHNTEYRTRKDQDEIDQIRTTARWLWTPAQRAWARKVKRALCGIEGCKCGQTELDER
jgi:hypothetical protein